MIFNLKIYHLPYKCQILLLLYYSHLLRFKIILLFIQSFKIYVYINLFSTLSHPNNTIIHSFLLLYLKQLAKHPPAPFVMPVFIPI